MDRDLGPGTSEARGAAVIMAVPPMSKAERLHRWAASLELHKRRQAGNGAFATRGGRGSEPDRSPLAIASQDWAFEAEGLRSAGWGDARAFFELSEGEMRHILGSPTHRSRKIPAAVAAERIRALAEQAEAAASPEGGDPVAGGRSGPAARNSRWSPTAAGYRRETGAASAAS